jgi:hypothetical protein
LAQRILTGPQLPPTRTRALAVTEGLLYRAALATAGGQTDQARQSQALASAYWSEYLARRSPEDRERMALPSLDELREQAQRRALADRSTNDPRVRHNP